MPKYAWAAALFEIENLNPAPEPVAVLAAAEAEANMLRVANEAFDEAVPITKLIGLA